MFDTCKYYSKHLISHRSYNDNDIADIGLIDSRGNPAGPESFGLLIINNGTVCNDYFTANSADAICREMGYSNRMIWGSGYKWKIQREFGIWTSGCARGVDDLRAEMRKAGGGGFA